MLVATRSLKGMLLAHLGHCPRCMRMSFVASATAWVLLIVAYATASSIITTLAALVAISLTILWVSHVIVFAWKATTSAYAPAKSGNRTQRIPSLSRREFVPIFLRTLTFAVVITTYPNAITSVFGQDQGPCDGCSRYKGTNTCWTCCRCQNTNCITGCKNTSGGNPDKYNTCIGNCSTTLGNCNKTCQ